jgi:hypothetical protein
MVVGGPREATDERVQVRPRDLDLVVDRGELVAERRPVGHVPSLPHTSDGGSKTTVLDRVHASGM